MHPLYPKPSQNCVFMSYLGLISIEEFRQTWKLFSSHLHISIDDATIDDLAHSIDSNKDGSIDFNEFLEAFRVVHKFERQDSKKRWKLSICLVVHGEEISHNQEDCGCSSEPYSRVLLGESHGANCQWNTEWPSRGEAKHSGQWMNRQGRSKLYGIISGFIHIDQLSNDSDMLISFDMDNCKGSVAFWRCSVW